MSKKMTITNESGKKLSLLIDPANMRVWRTNTIQPRGEVEWRITPSQWRRLVAASDNTPWYTEQGELISWWCSPYAAGCRYPGRK